MKNLRLSENELFVLFSLLDHIYVSSNICNFSTDLNCYLHFTENNFKILCNIRDKFNDNVL